MTAIVSVMIRQQSGDIAGSMNRGSLACIFARVLPSSAPHSSGVRAMEFPFEA
jgi:hypothetical protein